MVGRPLPEVPVILRPMTRLVALGAATGLALLVLAAPAAAHDELTGSSPAAGSTVDRLPVRVVLYFAEAPAATPLVLTVRGPAGAKVAAGPPQLQGAQVSADLTGSDVAGTYSVDYRIVSDDGHPVAGTVRFTLTPSADEAASAPPATGRADDRRTGSPWFAVGAGVIAAAALALGGFTLRRRRVAAAPAPAVR